MRGEGRLSERQVHEMKDPLRFRIVELFTSDPCRSLAVAELAADLGADFEDTTLSQVNYHLRRLQDVDLIPRPDGS